MVTTQTNPPQTSSARPRPGDPADRSVARDIRPLGRRPSLPAGRAIIGGLLVTVAAIGTFAAYANANAGPAHSYVVAVAPVLAGQRLTADDLRTIPLELPEGVEQQAFASVAELDGATALAPIDANQLIAPASVRLAGREAPGTATHEFSFALDREKALGGHLQRGERIDAVATYGSGSDAYSQLVIRRARVVDVDTGAKGTVGSSSKVTITVALDDEHEVLEAMHAIEIGKVTLVRTTGDAPAGDADTFQPHGPADGTGAAQTPRRAGGTSPAAPSSADRGSPTTAVPSEGADRPGSGS